MEDTKVVRAFATDSMKMRLLILGLGLMLPAVLSADSLLLCSGSLSCGGGTFNDGLSWTSAGSAFTGLFGSFTVPNSQASYTGTSTGGNTVTATPESGSQSSTLQRRDNTNYFFFSDPNGCSDSSCDPAPFSNWEQFGTTFCDGPGMVLGPSGLECASSQEAPDIGGFNGHFTVSTADEISNPLGTGSLPNVTDYGDALLTSGSGAQPGGIVLTFGQTISDLSFHISAQLLTSFKATLFAYDSSNNLIGEYKIAGSGDGGTCSTLPATACDDAPLMALSTTGGNAIKWVTIDVTNSDNTPAAFAIDGLQLGSGSSGPAIPEPGAVVVVTLGLCGVAWYRRRAS